MPLPTVDDVQAMDPNIQSLVYGSGRPAVDPRTLRLSAPAQMPAGVADMIRADPRSAAEITAELTPILGARAGAFVQAVKSGAVQPSSFCVRGGTNWCLWGGVIALGAFTFWAMSKKSKRRN